MSIHIQSLNLELYQNLKAEDFFFYTEKGKQKLITPLESSILLLKDTDLKLCKSYPDINCFFIYNKKKGYYKRLSRNDLIICLISLLKTVAEGEFAFLINLTDSKYIDHVYKNLSHDPLIYNTKTPVFDSGYLVMVNGLLDYNKMSLQEWTPNVFIPNYLPCEYDPEKKALFFSQFVDHLCDGMKDRKEYLKAIFYTILLGKTELQVFFYLYGYAGTGKSTVGTLLSYLIGEEGTCATSLKALNTDPFEIANLIGKKRVVISDTEQYFKDLSVLKAAVGQDALRARTMHTQGTQQIVCEGIILIIGNEPLATRIPSMFLTPCIGD